MQQLVLLFYKSRIPEVVVVDRQIMLLEYQRYIILHWTENTKKNLLNNRACVNGPDIIDKTEKPDECAEYVPVQITPENQNVNQ